MVLIGIRSNEYPVAVGSRSCGICRGETIMIKRAKKTAFTVLFIPVLPVMYSKHDVCIRCGNKTSSRKFTRDLTNEFLIDELPI